MTYEIIRRIGRGGMGVVDLARDPAGHEVALKRLSLHGTPEELERARIRIRREAEVLQQLDDPGIVRLREVLDDGDDVVLVMDHLPGGNLAQRVEDDGPLSPPEVAALADRLLGALAAAHRQGVVHRDIKPANVLFDAEGRPALADFGVALHRDATPGLTADETVVGTPGFIAPEQARGEVATTASDVFSLGATLLYAATGRGPYGTGDPRVLLLRAAAGRTERPPRDLPPDLRQRLEAMLAKDPAARPSAAEARGGTDGTAVLEAPARRRIVDGWGRTVAVVVVLAILAVGGAAAILTHSDGSQAPLASPTTVPRTTTTRCKDLPFQPCGERPAPNTDGRRCLDGTADYDADPRNGCEAEPDELRDGAPLDGRLTANLVPTDDRDSYQLDVRDKFQFDCGGQVHVTLTAPRSTSQRLTVLDSDRELGTAVSGDGEPATVTIDDPTCGSNDATTLTVTVTSVGSDRSALGYVLEARGTF
ncbi:MAG: serine/threonine-protein kinase [Acidimicrobiales bacterium]